MKIAVDAYLDNNLGDDLMIKLFADHFSEHDIYIFEDSSVVRETFKNNKNIIFFDKKDYDNKITEMDMHVTIGGSMFILDSLKNCIRFRHRIKKARKLKKLGIPAVVIGCNMGPFYKKHIGINLAKWELKYKEFVTVRDQASFDILLKSNLKIPVYLYPDIVFSKCVERSTTKYGLGISVYRSKNKNVNNYRNYKYLSILADHFIEITNKRVALFSFDSENENDLVAAHYIKQFSRNKNKIEIVPYLSNAEDFINEFAKSEKIVGIRFHSSVLALRLGVPLLAVYYSNKTKNLMKDLGMENYSLSLSKLYTSSALLDAIENNTHFGTLNKTVRENMSVASKGHFIELEKLMNKIAGVDE